MVAGRSHVIQRLRLNGELQPLFFHYLLCGFSLPRSLSHLCLFSFQESDCCPLLCQSASCVKDSDDCIHVWLASLRLRRQSRTEFSFKHRPMRLLISNLTVPVPGFSFPSPLVASPQTYILCPSELPVSNWPSGGG